MDIVFISGGDTDKSGNTITALFLKARLGPIVNGRADVAGYGRATLSFKSVDAMLAWASKEHNGGAPCIIDGARVVPAPATPEKPAKVKAQNVYRHFHPFKFKSTEAISGVCV